ncbi:MAG: SPFH domain-containing protein, partial [Spirochaetota bacterium]
MGLIDGIKRQLRSVIEWKDPPANVLFQRWTDNGDEIKNASKLIVGPGQGVIFVYEGKTQAVITEPGMTDIATANIPFITTIKKFMQAFQSEHKVGIYFFRTSEILNQGWGTPGPVKYVDPQYKFPVGLKAFGNFSFRITDGGAFFINVMGQKDEFTVEELRQAVVSRLVQPLTDHLAEAKFGYNDIDSNRNEIAEALKAKVSPVLTTLGFELKDFRVEQTDFDDDTKRRVNRVADVQAEAEAAKTAGLDFAEMQRLSAMRDAAKNEGIAGAGVGMGVGMLDPIRQMRATSSDPYSRGRSFVSHYAIKEWNVLPVTSP